MIYAYTIRNSIFGRFEEAGSVLIMNIIDIIGEATEYDKNARWKKRNPKAGVKV